MARYINGPLKNTSSIPLVRKIFDEKIRVMRETMMTK